MTTPDQKSPLLEPPARPHSRPNGDTGDIPSDGQKKKEISVSLSVLIGAIMMLVGIASFAANFLFATKSEVAESKIGILAKHTEDIEKIHEVRTGVVELKGEVAAVKQEVQTIKRTQDEQRVEQRVIDENLRRLLRREGVRAFPKAK